MNKKLSSLEALEKIKYSLADKNGHICLWDRCCLGVIEKALKDYEKLNGILPDFIHSEEDLKNLCSRELKELQAFEIIKEKEVNIKNFKKWVIGKEWSYNDYLDEITDVNTDGYYFSKIILTKEEFDLLKEVLCK